MVQTRGNGSVRKEKDRQRFGEGRTGGSQFQNRRKAREIEG